jgi:hypothetical protein
VTAGASITPFADSRLVPSAGVRYAFFTFGTGTVTGILLGLALGSKALEWLGALYDAVS